MTDEGELVVGRQEAVYSFSKDGRGATYALEGEKALVVSVKRPFSVKRDLLHVLKRPISVKRGPEGVPGAYVSKETY